jgi:hypothetical protein
LSALCDAAMVLRGPSEVEEVAAEVGWQRCLLEQGFVRVPGPFASRADAWATAMSIATAARDAITGRGGLGLLQVVGEFNLPPDGTEQRDFQALHIDFGVPRVTAQTVDVALYTALHIDVGHESSGTTTRLVSLRRLSAQRAWPEVSVITERLRSQARDASASEGILARIIEHIDQSCDLPVKDEEFLCGMEFNDIEAERQYHQRHGIDLSATEQRVALGAGELILFDNLAIAHGRLGQRPARELHQLCIGIKRADRSVQTRLLEELAACIGTGDPLGGANCP